MHRRRRRRRQGRTEADAAAGAPEAQAGRGSDEFTDQPLARVTPGTAQAPPRSSLGVGAPAGGRRAGGKGAGTAEAVPGAGGGHSLAPPRRVCACAGRR